MDASMSKVTRKITSFNRINNFTRSKKETIKTFADSFLGFAASHLEYIKNTSSYQVGQALAIPLIKNANLEDKKLTRANLQLISLSEERCKSDITCFFARNQVRSTNRANSNLWKVGLIDQEHWIWTIQTCGILWLFEFAAPVVVLYQGFQGKRPRIWLILISCASFHAWEQVLQTPPWRRSFFETSTTQAVRRRSRRSQWRRYRR